MVAGEKKVVKSVKCVGEVWVLTAVEPRRMKIFRPPVKPKEEAGRKAAKPLDEAGRQQVLAHLWIAGAIAKRENEPGGRRVGGVTYQWEDLFSEAAFALVAAGARFVEGHDSGVPFRGFAWKNVRLHFQNLFRAEQKSAAVTLGDNDQAVRDDDAHQPGDEESEPDAKAELAKLVVAMLREYLTRREFQAVWEVFAEAKSHADVAATWGSKKGSNRNNVRQHVFKARARARALFPELAEAGW
jgi:DNA-directed RNA polymerase specialized sigma24 family protein